MNPCRPPAGRLTLALILALATCACVTNQYRVIQQPPGAAGISTLNAKTLGAIGDGETVETAVLQSALDLCAQAGGGTLYVPPGTYLSATLNIPAFTTLYVDSGATLRLADGATAPLLRAQDAETVTVTGRGVLIGEGVGADKCMLVFMGCRDVEVSRLRIVAPKAIRLADCFDARIEGLTLRGAVGLNLIGTTDGTIVRGCLFDMTAEGAEPLLPGKGRVLADACLVRYAGRHWTQYERALDNGEAGADE